MRKKTSSIRSGLKPNEEVHITKEKAAQLQAERADTSRDGSSKDDVGRGEISKSEKNGIFWGSKVAQGTSFFQKLRAEVWFYPDNMVIWIHRLRPLSYIFIYTVILFFAWQTYIYAANNENSILNPPPNQELYEGVVGKVSAINPLFVTHNQVERDLQALVFNKVVHIGPDGNPLPEIADTWATTEDGKTYTFFLNKDVYWQDGKRLTSDDIIFTIETIQNLKGDDSFSEVFAKVEMSKIDDFTVVFKLPEPSATFMESIAVPVIPKHILEGMSNSELKSGTFNTLPIGTGPFQVVKNDETKIVLKRNPKYFKGEPKLKAIEYIFYPTEEEAIQAVQQFETHTLTQASTVAVDAIEKNQAYEAHSYALNLRFKLIYLNLREEGKLSSEEMRTALSQAINRKVFITDLRLGSSESTGPIHEQSWAYDDTVERFRYNKVQAEKKLEAMGWKYPEGEADEGAEGAGEGAETETDETQQKYREKDGEQLAITLSMLDSPQNYLISEELKRQWAEVGIKLVVDTQNYDQISKETIPRRDFEALLFELESSSDPDKYNLWHSTKSDHPGLNLPGYSYERVDIILERARAETEQGDRKNDYRLFQKYIMQDMPALYLYHPEFTFITHSAVQGIDLTDAVLPHDRYNNVQAWYIEE